MKIFYGFSFNVSKYRKNKNLCQIITGFLTMENKKYKNLIFNIFFYEFENQNIRGYKKKLLENQELKKYLTLSDYDTHGMREIRFSNYNNADETCSSNIVIKEISESINNLEKDVFYEIAYSRVNWYDLTNDKSKDYYLYQFSPNITISRRYNGDFVELWFEIDSKNNDYMYFLNKFSDYIGVNYHEQYTKVCLTEEEKNIYAKVDRSLMNLFFEIERDLTIGFNITQTDSVKKVPFGSLLKRKIINTGYKYIKYAGGDYTISRQDKNNNCIKILWIYDWNLRQLNATVRYLVPYSIYGYVVRMPLLRDNIDRENIEKYIEWVIEFTDRFIDDYSYEIAQKFPRTPEWFEFI